jgi:hypothetical protein
MKKVKSLIFAALFAAVCVGFGSCDKDDDEGSSSDLIGTWELVSVEGMDGNMPIYEEETGISTFKSNGTGTNKFEEDGETISISFKWKLNDDILSIAVEEDDWETSKIVKLTSTELIINEWYDEDDDENSSYLNHIYQKVK